MNFKPAISGKKIREVITGIERPVEKVIALLIVLGAGAGIYVFGFSGTSSIEGAFYMTANDRTTNGFTADGLERSQSASVQSDFVETSTGGQTASWGARIFKLDENGTVNEITGGSPVAEVSRSSAGTGIQSANFTVPETNLHYNDALLVRVYIQVGSGSYERRAQFITEDLDASKLSSKDWRFNYYTEYETETGGPPFNRFTRATFYWGDSTVNSRIEGLNYSTARLELEDRTPANQFDTYTGQEFTHSANITCKASSCNSVEVNPQVCKGRICSDFRDSSEVNGLEWNASSVNYGNLARDSTVKPDFNVEVLQEGSYRIRFNVSTGNLGSFQTDSTLVESEKAEIGLENFTHENLYRYGVNQYETGDNIEFLNATAVSEAEFYNWLAATSSPQTAKREEGIWEILDSEPGSPSESIYAGDSNQDYFYLGGGSGELIKWNGSFTSLNPPFSSNIIAVTARDSGLLVTNDNPGYYFYDETEDTFTDLGNGDGNSPVSASNSFGDPIGGEYYLIGTGGPSILRLEDGSFNSVEPGGIFGDTVRGMGRNETHFVAGDSSGNLGIYNGNTWKDISSSTGFDGSFAIYAIENGAFRDNERPAFHLIGGGSGHIEKLYENGTSYDLSGDLPGSWAIRDISYSSYEDAFLVAGGNGNVYKYNSTGFYDLTPPSFGSDGSTVRYIDYTEGFGGKAFNLSLSTDIRDSSGSEASWSPEDLGQCGELPLRNTCERSFSGVDIPVDAEAGNYRADIGFKWNNGGPGNNDSNIFEVVDVRGTFSSNLVPDGVIQGESSTYEFTLTNEWSEYLTDVNISINCNRNQLNCSEQSSSFTSTLGSDESFTANFNIETDQSTTPTFYDLNATVEYSNPGEQKEWREVENEVLRVNSNNSLLTNIVKLPENDYRAEYSHNITYTDTPGPRFGPLNGEQLINEIYDAQGHAVYGTLKAEGSDFLRVYHQDGRDGGWNVSNIGDGEGNEYCVYQTVPENYVSCPNPPKDLVAHYSLDGESARAEELLNGYDGELNGGITQGTEGKIASSYSFDGNDDWINLSDQPSEKMADSGFTLSAWIKNPGPDTETIVAANRPDGTDSIVFRVDGELSLRVEGSGYSADTSARSSAWTHVAVVLNGTTGEGAFYLNGTEDSTFTVTDRFNSDDIWSIGQRYGSGTSPSDTTQFFDGKIDDLRLYSRPLSQQKIESIDRVDSNLGTEIQEPLGFPDRLTRDRETIRLEGYYDNNADEAAENAYLNWSLESGWDIVDGSRVKFNDSVPAAERVYNNITAGPSITAPRGSNYINLTSNSSNVKGGLAFEQLDVYAETSLSSTPDTTDVLLGETVTVGSELLLDTGAVLENQRISLTDQTSGEFLDEGLTDSQGEISLSFTVPEDWKVQEHSLKTAYDGNETIYTNPSSDLTVIDVHDRPSFDDIDARPQRTGYGLKVRINGSVIDQDGIESVNLTVEKPSGTEVREEMKRVDGSIYEANFSDNYENGEYRYSLEALDSAGYSNISEERSFEISVNATSTVATGRDDYGPNEEIDLDRNRDIRDEADQSARILAQKRYAEQLYSETFDTIAGTSTDHTDTHSNNGVTFDMTEQDGSPPDTPDEFEGIYSYETELSEISRIDLRSRGSVSGGTWEVYARNYETGDFDQVFSISETTEVWDNNTVCSGSGCSNYVSNGNIEIRVFTQSGRGSADDSYSVDYQDLRLKAAEGPVTKELSPKDPVRVGRSEFTVGRYYNKLDLEKLPFYRSAQIQQASLYINVTGGFGTGEVHHTQNFTASDPAREIYQDGEPPESSQTNPVATFSTTQGVKKLDITGSLNSTFEAGKRYYGIQLREQGDSTFFDVEEPIYLEINYTARSEVLNTGDTDTRGSLLMRIQRNSSSGWENVGFPVVTPSDGIYRLNSSESIDLARIWNENGGFNTGLRESGRYRVLTRFTDPDGNTVQTDSGEKIRSSYEFDILGPQLNLTDIDHENLNDYSVNEYETRDTIDFINITVNNSQAEAVDASALLQVIDDENNTVAWGPDSRKSFGDILPGASAERRWDNTGSGYSIPETASSGTFTFRWNTTLEADNAEKKSNYSIEFLIHDVPGNFSSEILDTDNQIFRNDSTVYNVTVYNPWSESIRDVNVSVNYDSNEISGEALCRNTEISCTVTGPSSSTASFQEVNARSEQTLSFNISTDPGTEIGNYDLNTSIEYVNPGSETRRWEQRENKILEVRIPGSLLNVTGFPQTVTRGGSGYSFTSYANNTFSGDLTNVTLNWEIPEDWNNQSQDLRIEQEVQQPGELIYNNFTAEVSADERRGTYRINETTDNDQGRVDEEFFFVDVYANTTLSLTVNDSDPAVNETVELTALLELKNGSAVEGEKIRITDERTGEIIDTVETNSLGVGTTEYEIGSPLGNHTLNATYFQSDSEYLRSSRSLVNATVRDRPNVTDLSADPFVTGFGFNRTINATVRDSEGVNNVRLRVDYPSGKEKTYSMTEVAPDVYEFEFPSTWEYGPYGYEVIAEDDYGITSSNSSYFLVNLRQKSSIETERVDYFPDQDVNLTEKNDTWWNKDFDYRRSIDLTETGGNQLSRYPVKLDVQNLQNSTSCTDLRYSEDSLNSNDLFVESCNPSGTSTVYVSTNLSASATEENYLYYGNSSASAEEEFFAYPIRDAGVVDPGSPTVDESFEYNSGNSVFRKIEVTMFGNGFSGTVTADYYSNDSTATLFDGSPASGTTVVDRTYYQDPKFSSVRVQMSDGGGGQSDDVSFEYNFTTPSSTSSTVGQEQDSLPSVIETFDYDFQGRVILEVLENRSGGFERVETVFNDTTPRTITGAFSLYSLWNQDPFYTGSRNPGTYRAKFRLADPEGNTLEDAFGLISRAFSFDINPPRSDVSFEEIRAYNVSGAADLRTSTRDIEDSGLNSTLELKGNETYRIEVNVNNSDSAEQSWSIDSGDSVTLRGLNSSWNVVDIYYENETQEFNGGTFDGNVSWDTANGGTVRPGTEANFTFIVEIPNVNDLRDIKTTINDTTFVRTDSSELRVIKQENIPPEPLSFEVDSNVTRGTSLNASAYWNEPIDNSQAEYNSTSPVLNNFTVNPENRWTNYSAETDSEWVRGKHFFEFWATDGSGNTNSTVTGIFDVFGLASVDQATVNETRVNPGQPVSLKCRIQSDSGDGIGNYNVTFYNNTQVFGYGETNSTGWTSTTYSSGDTGFVDLGCSIEADLERFFKIGVQNRTDTVRIAEEEPPEWFEYGANSSRFFKTSDNDTGKWFAYWNDNTELDTAAVVRGKGIYSFTQNEFIHEINSGSHSLIQSLNGTEPVDEGLDKFDHLVYGTLKGLSGEEVDIYHSSKAEGGWNDTIVANSTSEYCSIQTQPVNYSACENSGSLVSMYLMDESGKRAWDHVGKNHGELKGGVSQSVNGYIGSGYSFDDSDDYINLSDTISDETANSGLTLSAWFKNPGSNTETVIAANSPDGTDSVVFRVDGELSLRVEGSGYSADTSARSSAWTHGVVTINGSTGEGVFYLNGTEDGTFSTNTRVDTGDIWSIGQKYGGSISVSSTTQHFSGEMDNVRIYDRALNSSEIDDLYVKTQTVGDKRRVRGDLPESEFGLETLSGSESWSNITVDIPLDYPLGDYSWTVFANDTSSNINSTEPINVDIWAWAFVDEQDSGASSNPVGVDETFSYQCRYRQGNGTNIQNYQVEFWDNNTADGSFQRLGSNTTGPDGAAEWYKSYSNTGSYELKCNTTEDTDLNVKPFPGFREFTETIQVSLGDTEPPVIVDGNYGLNTSEVYKGFGSVLSFAEWNETIDYSFIEFNSTESNLSTEKVPKPYSSNFTNITIDTTENWVTGTHYVKTYANDTEGNLNDTLEFLKFDVYGFSQVKWQEPTGSVEKGLTDLKCRVSDNQTGTGISDYTVEFFDDNSNFIGSNQTGSDGTAVYTYNTSDQNTGERTWSCRIQDAQDLYYNASSQNTDSETVQLVDQISARISGDILEPLNNTKLAQNKTFDANVSVSCSEGNCGEVNATLRYNETGIAPDTEISETQAKPFYIIGSNPQSCGSLDQGQKCNISFEVNATGAVGSLNSLDAELEADNTQVNSTETIRVGIEELLILNVNYSEIDYGTGSPGTVVEADRNAQNEYIVSLDENSNDATGGIWGNMSIMTNTQRSATDDQNMNNKIRPVNSTWDEQSTCAYSASESFSSGFIQFKDYLEAGDTFAKCYFQEIPYGKYEGSYEGTLTIKVNRTN